MNTWAWLGTDHPPKFGKRKSRRGKELRHLANEEWLDFDAKSQKI
jgi:hypothetical protein